LCYWCRTLQANADLIAVLHSQQKLDEVSFNKDSSPRPLFVPVLESSAGISLNIVFVIDSTKPLFLDYHLLLSYLKNTNHIYSMTVLKYFRIYQTTKDSSRCDI
jgi:hypothetical protein